ncbi:DEAD/DEAH box helicase family protein [Oxalicibacterium faecigallinarum]|uniref:Uncharacterized protein n=1 Tax=Oxalicibacterium faecigallinarum TaxID=573741 RepID=A0A8J3AMX9_9BURK|nr:DEAD/DEAH box helicase family protein [Oxalicibacterium faecigallinarum]GGI15720.1 hypothetical protein GCM10008066_00310 [Oxalicibacterium faecigallinarum]
MNQNTFKYHPISPVVFAQEFGRHWTDKLGYAASPALEEAWMSLGKALSAQVFHYDREEERQAWTVVPLPTGTGKSQGTAFYCAMLASHGRHPGALIVVRRIEDADIMAATINELAGKGDGYAYSHHSAKSSVPLSQLAEHPVLVITHSAYRNALAAETGQVLNAFLDWGEDGRCVVVIDEAFDLVEVHQVTLDDLRQTLAFIPDYLRDRFPKETAAIQAAINLMESSSSSNGGSRIFMPHDFGTDNDVDLSQLKDALHSVTIAQVERISQAAARLASIFDSSLDNLEIIIKGWSLYSKVPIFGQMLQTARPIITKGSKGAAVLDATASTNLMYQLFPQARVCRKIAGVRSYQNVSLHVRRGSTGKVNARKQVDERLPVLMSYFNDRIAGKDALFVCHKDVKAKAYAQETKFTLKAGHWGELDGANTWKDCDTAIFYDLHQRPHGWAMTTYFALQGIQSDEWLNSTQRRHGDHPDIVTAMVTYQTITDLIQALNRVRCRLVIDEQGNCPQTDIYLTLPKGNRGDLILSELLASMPGMQVSAWHLPVQTSKRKQRSDAGKPKESVYNYMRNVPSGRYLISHIKDSLGIKDASMKRIIKECKQDTDNQFHDINVSYFLDGFGRGSKAYLVKH